MTPDTKHVLRALVAGAELRYDHRGWNIAQGAGFERVSRLAVEALVERKWVERLEAQAYTGYHATWIITDAGRAALGVVSETGPKVVKEEITHGR